MDLFRKPSDKSLTNNCGIGSTLARFHRFLLEDTVVVAEVAGPVFYYLARNIFSLLALVLIIGAFLARTLGPAALIGFLPAAPITGAAPVLEPISSLSLTSLGVALRLRLNAFGLRLGPLSSSSFISDWTSRSDSTVR
ncbi:hypothetical protein V2W45_1335981 [Cenococcum geophilum]